MMTLKRACAMLTGLAALLMAGLSAACAEETVLFDVKTPLEYSLEEYKALTPQQQDEFFLWFDSVEAFEAWMAEAAPPMPWEAENRDPADYTWEEFSALTYAQQDAFIASFDSVEAFERWMEAAQPETVVILPWEQEGKTPDQYTWAEYESLSTMQKNAFVEWFGDETCFEAWMQTVEGGRMDAVTMPWEGAAKQPDGYTWAEFEALTILQQDAFIEWFGDAAVFEAWMEQAQAEEQDAAAMPWEGAAKQPDGYTWAEFEALTIDQQNAFIAWFGSPEIFEAWMEAARPDTRSELVIPWANDSKQPDLYTEEEFEALTAHQQSRFFAWFGTPEAFEQWLGSTTIVPDASYAADDPEAIAWSQYEQMSSEQRIQFFMGFQNADSFSRWVQAAGPDGGAAAPMPWDNTKKQPDDYTWEEYEALPLALQDEFFAWFESAELFEVWMKDTAGREVLSELGVYERAPIRREVEPEDVDTLFLMGSEMEVLEAYEDEERHAAYAQEDEDAADDGVFEIWEAADEAFPCRGRTLMDSINMREACSTDSALAGKVHKKGTEVTVLESTLEGDTVWYLVDTGRSRGYIRGDLLELIAEEKN